MSFIDKYLGDEYTKNGYLQIPFLSHVQLDALDTVIAKYYIPETNKGFIISNQTMERELNIKLNNEINKVITESIERYLIDFNIFFSVVASKPNTMESALRLHTDRSIIDEGKNMPVNIWIPLCNVSKENGTLCVFEGSHRFTHSYRGMNTREYYLEGEFYEFIENNCLKALDVKRGEAVFYHAGIIHGSSVNHSSSVRNALIVSMFPKNADVIYGYQRQKCNWFKKVGIYKANIEYWLPNPQTDPKGILPLLYKKRNTKAKIKIEEFKKMITQGK